MITTFSGVIEGELWMGGSGRLPVERCLKPGEPLRKRIERIVAACGDFQSGTRTIAPGSVVEFTIHRNGRIITRTAEVRPGDPR